MKSNLYKQGNKYEIIQFIVDQSKKSLGLRVAEKPMSILERDKDEDDWDDEDDSGYDDPVEDLPEKVDLFLDYINKLYFEGELDMKSKQVFGEELKLQQKVRFAVSNDSEDNSSDNDDETESMEGVRKRPILRTE